MPLFRKVKSNPISFFQIIIETLLISEIPNLGTPAMRDGGTKKGMDLFSQQGATEWSS